MLLEGRCRDCRFWNGAGARLAPCFKIKGYPAGDSPGSLMHSVDAGGAGFHDLLRAGQNAFLATGPDFGCVLFEAGKPRFWGDDGTA